MAEFKKEEGYTRENAVPDSAKHPSKAIRKKVGNKPRASEFWEEQYLEDYEEEKPVKRKKKNKGRSGCLLLIALFVLALIGFGVYGYSIINEISGDVDFGEEVTISIEQGESPATIAQKLEEAGVIKHDYVFRYYLRYTGKAAKLQYGEFTLTQGDSFDNIIEALSRYVKRDTVTVTFPEGIPALRFAQLMEENGLCTQQEFLDCANGVDGSDFSQYSFWNEIPDNPNLFMRCEGYLFPNTYEFFKDDTVYNYVSTFYAEFDKKFSEGLRSRAAELGMTLEEALTLASFVQEEAGNAESARVSAVFHNRLAENSPFPRLESNVSSYVQNPDDNNYIYNWIAPYYGGWDNIPENIYNAYETYSLTGLPAGPVSNPGLDAIQAALYPDENFLADKYYFFVTDKNGKYYYAKTVSEHQRNVNVAFSVK